MRNLEDFDYTNGVYETTFVGGGYDGMNGENIDKSYTVGLIYDQKTRKFVCELNTYEFNAITEYGIRVFTDEDVPVRYNRDGRSLELNCYIHLTDIEKYLEEFTSWVSSLEHDTILLD